MTDAQQRAKAFIAQYFKKEDLEQLIDNYIRIPTDSEWESLMIESLDNLDVSERLAGEAAEVRELHLAVAREQHVGRRHVAVHDTQRLPILPRASGGNNPAARQIHAICHVALHRPGLWPER